jgi:hypothetical protein
MSRLGRSANSALPSRNILRFAESLESKTIARFKSSAAPTNHAHAPDTSTDHGDRQIGAPRIEQFCNVDRSIRFRWRDQSSGANHHARRLPSRTVPHLVEFGSNGSTAVGRGSSSTTPKCARRARQPVNRENSLANYGRNPRTERFLHCGVLTHGRRDRPFRHVGRTESRARDRAASGSWPTVPDPFLSPLPI